MGAYPRQQGRLSPAVIALIAVMFVAVLILVLVLSRPAHEPQPQVTLDQARARAGQIIHDRYPDMEGVTPVEKEYSSKGSDFCSFTYSRDLEQPVSGGTVTLTQIVDVTVNKNTGEEIVSLSD